MALVGKSMGWAGTRVARRVEQEFALLVQLRDLVEGLPLVYELEVTAFDGFIEAFDLGVDGRCVFEGDAGLGVFQVGLLGFYLRFLRFDLVEDGVAFRGDGALFFLEVGEAVA